MTERAGLTIQARIVCVEAGARRETDDELAAEEPLEIRLAAGSEVRSLAVTMRTPGSDFELAAGFLFAEGILRDRSEIAGISYCLDPALDEQQRYNVVSVELASRKLPELTRLQRHFAVTSACGVCGKASIEALQTRARRIDDQTHFERSVVTSLPEAMRARQRIFDRTGGLHAAALFDSAGTLRALREDVGRHNAVDKIVGWAFLRGELPLSAQAIAVSGRASYELAQKAIVAGAPLLCAVSAPSSLAVSLAAAFNLTLAGFVRGSRLNLYAAPERVV